MIHWRRAFLLATDTVLLATDPLWRRCSSSLHSSSAFSFLERIAARGRSSSARRRWATPRWRSSIRDGV